MKIDAVITWVDGNDPVHREKRVKYADPGMLKADDVAGDTRFVEIGEIKWCVASINRFAPWINKIYIVTDSQNPCLEPFMQQNFPEGYIPMEIVDHKVIFEGYEDYLPTFNACAIESMTWRIPGLSERYIQFNDDMLLCAPVTYEDFFTDDGRLVCYAGWDNIPLVHLTRYWKKISKPNKKVTFRGILCNAAILGGNKWSFLRINHNPRALSRDFYQTYFMAYPEALQRNIQYRFRNPDMYVPELMQYTIMHKEGLCKIRPVKDNLIYIQPKRKKNYIKRKLNRLSKGNYLFCCFNSIDKAMPEDLQAVRNWVTAKLNICL